MPVERWSDSVVVVRLAENPHMGGFFADDVGSRSWFPGINWSSFPDKAGYRAAAIALTQTLRDVANEHGLIFLVNGSCAAADLERHLSRRSR